MKSTLGIVGVMLVALCKCQLNDDDAKVHLALGWVEGEFRQNLLPEHSPYYAFHAIPYAEPPVGELRFKKPKNYTKSYGTFEDPYPAKDTDTNNKICPQLKNLFTDFAEDEDCLHLSVYSHDIHSSVNGSLLPVLVWIHGGDFESGSGMHRYFGPERFMKDQDIVMVSINYRLGTLGFLSLGNEELPGNAGLWDQVEALKWIQANIHSFGGNPGKVTIMGESAGSWSVMYQVLSPKSATLFQRVIAQSGTPMSPAYHEYAEDKAIEYGQTIAADLDCNITDSQKQLQCLQSQTVNAILNRQKRTPEDSPLRSQAVIDGEFLPMSPKMMMVMGQYNQNVDILLGCNKDEGLKFTTPTYADPAIIDQWRAEWMDWRGYMYMLGLDNDTITEQAKTRLDEINKYYLDGNLNNMTKENRDQITKMYTDSWYCYSGYDFISRHIANVKENNTYQYLYTHKGVYSPGSDLEGFFGVSHGDELFLQFSPIIGETIILEPEDAQMSDLLMSLWKNFIKYGDPSTEETTWEPIRDGNDRKYLQLNESATMGDSDEIKDRMNFWDGLMNGVFDD